MPGFPLQFTDEQDRAIAAAAAALGMKKRPWVMMLIEREIAKKPEIIPDKDWVFMLKNGEICEGSGVTVGDAWVAAGFSMEQVDKIEARMTKLQAQAAGWFDNPTDDDLPFGK